MEDEGEQIAPNHSSTPLAMAPSLKYVGSFIGDNTQPKNGSGKIIQLGQNVEEDEFDPTIDDTFVNSRDEVEPRVNNDQISRRDPGRKVIVEMDPKDC